MTLIIHVRKSGSVDIGESRVYSRCIEILETINEYNHPIYSIKYLAYGTENQIDKWLRKDVIRMEILQ